MGQNQNFDVLRVQLSHLSCLHLFDPRPWQCKRIHHVDDRKEHNLHLVHLDPRVQIPDSRSREISKLDQNGTRLGSGFHVQKSAHSWSSPQLEYHDDNGVNAYRVMDDKTNISLVDSHAECYVVQLATQAA